MTYLPIDINKWSRPGKELASVKAIVLHWVGNANQPAEEVRDYFNMRKMGNHGYGSAQFIIGHEGEVIQTMPELEVAYHCGSTVYTDYARQRFGRYASPLSSPNNCTIGIELCHVDWDGFMTDETFESAIDLCSTLLVKNTLSPLDITTHWNVALKEDSNGPCPKWFVEHPEDFQFFLERVRNKMGLLASVSI